MSDVLSSWERGTDENVVHVDPGRQMSTLANALKDDELSNVGVCSVESSDSLTTV